MPSVLVFISYEVHIQHGCFVSYCKTSFCQRVCSYALTLRFLLVAGSKWPHLLHQLALRAHSGFQPSALWAQVPDAALSLLLITEDLLTVL